MKRTTIFIPETLERDLQLYASQEGRPTASVVREALAEYIAARRSGASLPSFAGAFDSGHVDTAERHEEILFSGLTPHGEPESHPARSRRARRLPRKTRRRR
jgi:hypothetical protein